jgi:hypothetical protein
MGRRGVLISLGAFAAAATGAWAIWGNGSDPAIAALRITWPDPNPRRPEQLVPPTPLVHPPGSVLINLTDTPATFVANNNYSPAEMDVLAKAGVAQVTALATQNGPIVFGLWVLTVRDRAIPTTALSQANKFYTNTGYSLTQQSDLLWTWNFPVRQRGVTLNMFGAHYLRGRQLIKIEAYGPDATATQRAFTGLYDSQLRAWPPSLGSA